MLKRHCGICCIEVEWEDKKVSVIPALRTLSAIHGIPELKSRRISTSDDFAKFLAKWAELPSDYGILYISSHGFPGGVTLHDDDAFRANVRLPQIADALEQTEVDNAGCIIHFGSCSTQRASAQDFDYFRSQTGFDAVSGYRHDVDWIKSFAFDLLYLDHVVRESPTRLSAEYMESVRCDLRERAWYALGDALGFDIHTGHR
ncbi:MAG: hypothetical protein F4X81_02160 [Gammaproteobacteria bacterium]|nr:hypothetical protein [Gammaproteobacteria bacterium]MYE50254.1 hypothetical protein [Gammaproteobacteria bacterium]MYF51642.1 hypothetical protein [Gammaproteobacteria bacterium]